MEASVLGLISRLTTREWLLIASTRGAAMVDEAPDKLAALVDAVRALDRLGAPHALVGGVAVGLRSGVPRATLDTDLAVRSTVTPSAITEALTSARFRLTGTLTV